MSNCRISYHSFGRQTGTMWCRFYMCFWKYRVVHKDTCRYAAQPHLFDKFRRISRLHCNSIKHNMQVNKILNLNVIQLILIAMDKIKNNYSRVVVSWNRLFIVFLVITIQFIILVIHYTCNWEKPEINLKIKKKNFFI